MRTNCPICDTPGVGDWEMEFLVPDGWTNPTLNKILMCPGCGFIFYDNDKTQADYDVYYAERYGFDGNLHVEANLLRLDDMAALVTSIAKKNDLIVDFGGGREMYLTNKLNELGFAKARTVEVGDEMPTDIDVLVSSHVFEHIYDLRRIVGDLVNTLAPDGKMVIEVPDEWQETVLPNPVPILDYHQKHVNHFAPFMLDFLMGTFGLQRTYQHSEALDWYYGAFYRAVYERDVARKIYTRSRRMIGAAVAEKLELLDKVKGPVVVWGCGDFCLHMLAKVKLDVVYYVDRDPAFRGATIGGVPVRENVNSDHTIVVMAQNQKSGILHCIEQEGITNEVIVI